MFSRRRVLDVTQISVLVGVLAAVVLAVLVNVLVARRYTRWDWTANKRYSLSDGTKQTLRDLRSPVQIWVLVGSGDPLGRSLKQLLVAYQGETTKLDIHNVDPDRDVVVLEDIKKRFKIETGRTEDGRVVADAIVVVAHGDRHWFLTTADMLQVSRDDDTKVSPRQEQALTGAIRNVVGGGRVHACFTSGHGELSLLDEGGASLFKDILEKDNYAVRTVDTSAPNVAEPFAGCTVVVVAGMRGGFTNDEAERLRTWLLTGGSLLVASSPILGDSETGMISAGLDRVLLPFGIALDDDLVIERDPHLAFPGNMGTRFFAEAKMHAITAALVPGSREREVPRVIVELSRSMHRVLAEGNGAPTDLLSSSATSFGMKSITGAADWKDVPDKRAGDLSGPLALAMASERPKLSPSSPRGARVVVVGTQSLLMQMNFREPLPTRGGALLIENAISWLASQPQVLDVPDKSAVAAGMRITNESRAEIQRYVLFLMPGAVALLGIGVALSRRAGERKSKA